VQLFLQGGAGEWGQGRVVDLGDINRRWGLEAYLLL